MKKPGKRVLLFIGAFLVVLLGFGLFSNLPLLAMDPVKTGEIPNTDIYAVKDMMCTVFFINTGSGYIMIDAGMNPKKMEAALDKAGIHTNEIKWIFLTHSDGDHVGTLPLFSNAVIYMSEDELALINGTVKRSASGGNTMPPGIDINAIVLLSKGQEMSLNNTKVSCIKAPGHTDGSMLYLIDDKYLFTGDAFKIKKGIISVHPFTKDKELSMKTIEQHRETVRSSVVFTAHYGYWEKL